MDSDALEARLAFQSTRPVKGATALGGAGIGLRPAFQSTRPVKGATRAARCRGSAASSFNPRAP